MLYPHQFPESHFQYSLLGGEPIITATGYRWYLWANHRQNARDYVAWASIWVIDRSTIFMSLLLIHSVAEFARHLTLSTRWIHSMDRYTGSWVHHRVFRRWYNCACCWFLLVEGDDYSEYFVRLIFGDTGLLVSIESRDLPCSSFKLKMSAPSSCSGYGSANSGYGGAMIWWILTLRIIW